MNECDTYHPFMGDAEGNYAVYINNNLNETYSGYFRFIGVIRAIRAIRAISRVQLNYF